MDAHVFCQQCGREVSAEATFCAQCGARLAAPFPSVAMTDRGAGGVAAVPAQVSYVPPSFTTAVPVHYGGFWIRFVAALIDGILVQVVVLPIAFVLGGAIGVASVTTHMPTGGGQIVGMIVGFALGLVAAWVYEAAMESSAKQATLGKMIFSLQVTDLNGNRISFARATGRHFAKYLSSMILLIGYIMAGFSQRKQALHDLLAETLVRYTR